MIKCEPKDFPNGNFTLLQKPEVDIKWGMQSPDNEKEWKQWFADNIERFFHFTLMCYGSCGFNRKDWFEKLNSLAADLFDEAQSIGYTEGSDSAQIDAEEQW